MRKISETVIHSLVNQEPAFIVRWWCLTGIRATADVFQINAYQPAQDGEPETFYFQDKNGDPHGAVSIEETEPVMGIDVCPNNLVQAWMDTVWYGTPERFKEFLQLQERLCEEGRALLMGTAQEPT